MSEIARLILEQNSPDNNTRTRAELEFNDLVSRDPSNANYVLMHMSLNDEVPIDVRQACLLHIKRLVPKYWSLGFQSFIGPPINQELKQFMRTSLLTLATSSPNSKLRKSSGYAVVQIASVDYPDEWPDLLNILYLKITNAESDIEVIGALSLLNEVFDDLVLEEQFWEGGIANEVTKLLLQLLTKPELEIEAGICALKLYQCILGTLQSPEAFSTPSRKQFVFQHINSILPIFNDMLQRSSNKSLTIVLLELNFKLLLYDILTVIVGNFNKKIPQEFKEALLRHCLSDFDYSCSIFSQSKEDLLPPNQVIKSDEFSEPIKVLETLLRSLILVVLLLQHSVKINTSTDFLRFVDNLVRATTLLKSQIEDYEAEVNTYVTDIAGLGMTASVRDSVNELVSEMNEDDASMVFDVVKNKLSNDVHFVLKEAYLFILESLFINEDSRIVPVETSNTSVLQFLNNHINDQNHTLVISRCFLLLPRFFEKFSATLSVSSFGSKSFCDMIQFASTCELPGNEFTKMSSLVSANFYKNIINLSQTLDAAQKKDVQNRLFKLVQAMIEDSEEDSLPILLEAISVLINIDPVCATTVLDENGVNVVDLIFRIAFKDSSNIQLTIEASESLSYLLKQISLNDYLLCCEKSLPLIIDLLNRENMKGEVEYSADLYLSLELLSITVNSIPNRDGNEDSVLAEIFKYVFPPLYKLLLSTLDNQILQSGGEVFNSILKKASKFFLTYEVPGTQESGMTSLLKILSKFLSPELSDSAAVNCGNIVASLIEQFQENLSNEYLVQILGATVRRLVIAKLTITIENLIMVFTKLILKSPLEMIDFLSNGVSIVHPETGIAQDGLHLILPIWFDSFEVTRGYELIKLNSLALARIFTLNDPRVNLITVNGDIIPYQGDVIRTRSMTKAMPDQYTQIPAPLKIVKLLIGELEFQCQQPNADDYMPDVEVYEDDGDDGWEDMDDIGVPNYEKLKSYVDSDNEDNDVEGQNGDDSLLKILVQFFKECISKNLNDFRSYYELLNDEEKKTITENIAFE